MKSKRPNATVFLLSAAALCLSGCAGLSSNAASVGPAGSGGAIQSADVLEFGPSGVLFVGDSRAGVVHAVSLPSRSGRSEGAFNLEDIRGRVAEAAGATRGDVLINDLAVHPTSGEAVLALSLSRSTSRPALGFVKSSGEVELLNLSKRSASRMQLTDQPDAGLVFWGEVPARSYTITDIEWHGGTVYASGLSNGEFASVIRYSRYPFSGDVNSSSVSMYHAVHNQIETRAPIESFEIVNLEGTPHIVAAYLCTPIVTVPLSALKDGAHIRGKTIGELGWGNQPIDLVPLDIPLEFMKGPHLLLTNKQRHAMLMAQSDLEKHNNMAGLDQPVPFPLQSHAGVPITEVPLGHVSHVAEQDAQFLVALTSNKRTGDLELSSRRKGLFLRITEFVDEYDFPDYDYDTAPNAEFQKRYLQPTRTMLMTDEGFTRLVK